MIEDYVFYYNPLVSVQLSKDTKFAKHIFIPEVHIIYY